MKKVKSMNIIYRFILKLFAKSDYTHYINGPATLPPPLSSEDEREMISRLPDDEEAKKTLIEHNLRLVVYIAKRFENTNIGLEDLISVGTIGLIKAINTFRCDKQIKLATYASRCIENEILMHIRRSGYMKNELSLEEPLNTDCEGNELMLSDLLGTDGDDVYRDIERTEEQRILLKAIDTLPEREKLIIQLRFGFGGKSEKTQKEVADMLGISQSYISRLEKRIIDRLKDELKRLSY